MWSSNLVRQCRRDRFSRDDQGCRRRCNVSQGVRIGDIHTYRIKETNTWVGLHSKEHFCLLSMCLSHDHS